MIQALNGCLITTDATEQQIIPMVQNDTGDFVLAGRNIFGFELVSGSVKMSVGSEIDIDSFVHASHATAGDKWFHTVSPQTEELGVYTNLRGKGVATFRIYW